MRGEVNSTQRNSINVVFHRVCKGPDRLHVVRISSVIKMEMGIVEEAKKERQRTIPIAELLGTYFFFYNKEYM